MLKIGIAGLGLIGGSLAKAYKAAGAYVLGWNRNTSVTGYAKIAGDIDEELSHENIGECDCIFIAVYPLYAAEYVREIAPYVSRDAIVIDCCGTKREICKVGFTTAKEYGFTFIGGHPMAGSQYSGYKYSRADMFRGASMILVPPADDIELFTKVK